MMLITMLKLRSWFLRRISWLWDGKFYLMSGLAVIMTILYLCRFLTFHPSTVAVILSLGGLLIILWQLSLDAREFANHKPNTPVNWLRSYPFAKRAIIGAASLKLPSATVKARGSVSIASDATIERKVDFLMQRSKEQDEAINRVDDRVDELRSTFTNTEHRLDTDIRQISQSLGTMIAGHVVGTYDVSFFGITIAICGTLIQFFVG